MSIDPGIKIEVNASDELTDLIENRIDVTSCAGTFKNSSLIAKSLKKIHIECCASHYYIEKYTPKIVGRRRNP